MTHAADLSNTYALLLEEISEKLWAGESLDIESLEKRYPEYADRLLRVLPSMKALAQLGNLFAGRPRAVLVPVDACAFLEGVHDHGVVDGLWEGFKTKLGYGSEDQKAFTSGSPNSVGIKYLEHFISGLKEAGDDGIVIVGMHAPPINPKGSEYPHYFRETEHAD